MKVFSTRLFLNAFTLQVPRKFCHGKYCRFYTKRNV